MKTFCSHTLFYGVLIFLTFLLWACQTTPERPPGKPDPGVLKKEANEQFKVYVGKPESYGQDNTERYQHRDDGLLDGKFLGLKGTWGF